MGTMEDAFRKAGVTPASPEPLPEKPCARCGKNFRPGRPQHKLCEECAASARTERAASPRPEGPRPEGARPEGPRPERRERPTEGPPRSAEPGAERKPVARADARPPRRDFPPRTLQRELPDGYLADGYFAASGALRREVLTDWAEHIAEALAAHATEPTQGQLRLFLNHVKRAEMAVKYGRQPIEQVLNEIQKLKSVAVERASRRKIPEVLRRFIELNVDRVRDQKTLLAFAEHFQAVGAYAGGLLQRKERR